MENGKCYLRPNVLVEPLMNQWYAWPHLIAPVTAALNIANSHVKIMKSYVMAPTVHAAAVKNPAMRGGPFLDFDASRANEIRALLERTLKELAHMIDLAEATKTLNTTLLARARGYSLESLYQEVPEALKGYVELVYDLNNQPAVRFLEGLLYRSPYYNPAWQSVRLSLTHTDARPLIFSTPRLEDDRHVHVNVPFHHQALDELFSMRQVPQSLGYIKEALGFEENHNGLFPSFFTEEEPVEPTPNDSDSIRIRYFGHACLLIESSQVSVLTDPVISYKYESHIPRYTFSDLPKTINYVVLTHSHSDHVLLESLLQLRCKIETVIVPRNASGLLQDPSLRLILQALGFKNVIELDTLQSVEVDGGSITALPFLGEHADLHIQSKMAPLIRLGGRSILCAADSCNLESKLYDHLRDVIGHLDALFLGMECDGAALSWIYGALLPRSLDRKMDQSRRLNGSDFQKAIEIIHRLKCPRVYVYAMGQEPWLGFVTSIEYTQQSKPIVESDKLIETCRSRGLVTERLFGMKEIWL
jgi:L-ascorbate metabolism protein UlaG (beta-lactamase superfamily)